MHEEERDERGNKGCLQGYFQALYKVCSGRKIATLGNQEANTREQNKSAENRRRTQPEPQELNQIRFLKVLKSKLERRSSYAHMQTNPRSLHRTENRLFPCSGMRFLCASQTRV